nr:hypothetical protein [Tanacetum cinerariifolium]
MSTLVEFMILSGGDNRPPMLEKHLYDSRKSRMELYMQNRAHGKMILDKVEHGSLICPTIEENGVTKTKKMRNCLVSKDLWESVQLLMQGTSLTKQERECKLYDAFDKFAHIKGESLHKYYLRFIQLVNDINIYNEIGAISGMVTWQDSAQSQRGKRMLHGLGIKLNEEELEFLADPGVAKDFGKHFVPQQELSDEQAFRLQTSHPNTDQFASSPVKIETPWELPNKQLLIENDRLFDQIISQDIVNIVVKFLLDLNNSVDVNSSAAMNDSMNYVEMCNKCLELEVELIKQHNMVEKDEYNRLSKSFSKLEQHCISLELAMQLKKEFF